MRGLSNSERAELAALLTQGERQFDISILDELESCKRAIRYDIEPDGSFRMRPTALGLVALSLHNDLQ